MNPNNLARQKGMIATQLLSYTTTTAVIRYVVVADAELWQSLLEQHGQIDRYLEYGAYCSEVLWIKITKIIYLDNTGGEERYNAHTK